MAASTVARNATRPVVASQRLLSRSRCISSAYCPAAPCGETAYRCSLLSSCCQYQELGECSGHRSWRVHCVAGDTPSLAMPRVTQCSASLFHSTACHNRSVARAASASAASPAGTAQQRWRSTEPGAEVPIGFRLSYAVRCDRVVAQHHPLLAAAMFPLQCLPGCSQQRTAI